MLLTPEFIKSDGMRLLLFASLYHRQLARRRVTHAAWCAANPEKVKLKQWKYNRTEKGRAMRRRFSKTEKGKARHERYRLSEKGKAFYRQYAKTENAKACHKRYRESEKGKELYRRISQTPERKEYFRLHQKKMRPVHAAQARERWANDPHYRLVKNCRLRIRQALKMGGVRQKHKRTVELVGCSIAELKAHLESHFLPGMTWENHGRYGWHADHVRPVSKHDFTKPGQLEACFHYTNLRPLWWVDNLKKGDKYEEPELITA